MMKYLLMSLVAGTVSATNIEHCFNVAAKQYQIPNKLLKAIAKTETGLNPLAVHTNANHSYDLGIMQINSTWLPQLNRVGIDKAELLDGCKNIQIGAWILAQNIKRYGLTRKAIGAYNASTPVLQEKYAQLVLKNIE